MKTWVEVIFGFILGMALWGFAHGADYIYQPIRVPEARHTQPMGINDLGDVVGVSSDCDFGCKAQGFLFSDGQYYEIGVENVSSFTPMGINQHGVISGTISGQYGFVMDDAQTTILEGAARADSLNNNPDTVVVGYRTTQKFNQAAYLWRAGNYVQLVNPDLPGVIASAATGINDRGDVVGYWSTDAGDGIHVKIQGFVIRASGRLEFIPIIPLGINSAGVIVGMDGAGNDGAVLENGVVTLLTYPGADYTQVHGINNDGVIVGYSVSAGRRSGFTATTFATFAARAKKQAADQLAKGRLR
jgi:uncharacterized membrane protein